MNESPMFPLGSVLFPHMPLQLRVFEDRYLVMLSTVVQNEPAEFGVVLIERGQEVGGGEQRFGFGTVARILELQSAEGFIGVLGIGERRVEVIEWLDEDPYPRAIIRELEELEWVEELEPLRQRAEQDVRRYLAQASEFMDLSWASTVELSDDPIESSWQLAAIAPLTEIDQMRALRSTSLRELLDLIIDYTAVSTEALRTQWLDADAGLDLDEELERALDAAGDEDVDGDGDDESPDGDQPDKGDDPESDQGRR